MLACDSPGEADQPADQGVVAAVGAVAVAAGEKLVEPVLRQAASKTKDAELKKPSKERVSLLTWLN